MKRTYSTLAAYAAIFALLVCFNTRAQETIRYFGGPSYTAALGGGMLGLDLNWDGSDELRFESGTTCTATIPESCWDWISLTPSSGAAILVSTNYLAALPFGTLIGSETTLVTQWTTNSSTVAIRKLPQPGEPTLESPLQQAGTGYAGVRFTGTDGIHYGWLKLRIEALIPIRPVYSTDPCFEPVMKPEDGAMVVPPNSLIFVIAGPVVYVDEWAFETRPNTPIAAGAIPTPEAVAVGAGSRRGNIRIAWQSLEGAAYQVQFKDSLEANTWESVNLRVVATGDTAAAELPTPGVSRYFRIVRAD